MLGKRLNDARWMGGDTHGNFNRTIDLILKRNRQEYDERFMEVG